MFYLQPNQKRLLNSLNPLFICLLLFSMVVFRSTSIAIFPNLFGAWDVLLPFVVYFGQRRSLVEGLILTLFTAHVYSLCSSAPIGVFTTHYLILFLLARALSYVVYANALLTISLLIFVLTLLSRLLLPLVAGFFGHGWPIFSWENFSLLSPPLNTLFGLFLYVVIGWVDAITFKVPRINIELSEDGL